MNTKTTSELKTLRAELKDCKTYRPDLLPSITDERSRTMQWEQVGAIEDEINEVNRVLRTRGVE